MKKSLRYVITIYAAIFGVLSVCVPASVLMIIDHSAQLSNMEGHVKAVREYQTRNSRLPTHEELSNFPSSLSDRIGYRKDYFVSAEPTKAGGACFANCLASERWTMSYWDGHRSVGFTSWNNHYDLADEVAFCWPLLFFPLVSLALFSLSYALSESGKSRDFLASLLLDPFLPRPNYLPREMLAQLRNSVERPIYNLWRAGMVVPLCFAAAYWFIIHMMVGGDEINARSWCLLVSGGVISSTSLLISRRIVLKQRFLSALLTMLTYPLVFAGAMLIGTILDTFHCFMSGWQ